MMQNPRASNYIFRSHQDRAAKLMILFPEKNTHQNSEPKRGEENQIPGKYLSEILEK
jgi:hypothetical protein